MLEHSAMLFSVSPLREEDLTFADFYTRYLWRKRGLLCCLFIFIFFILRAFLCRSVIRRGFAFGRFLAGEKIRNIFFVRESRLKNIPGARWNI